ncbi:NADH-quinone oxidoreductase subunit J [Halofilum ochraceum]|uniref:NADH-quinone oxidoreductase subunit J n=1 Tax=Halofilum ochraceum TaxID=1611323 RepID=UPI0008DA745B|nr:NADH-quinone oxidoreductase subunit J [Halofilum ochraceum]
MPVEQLTFWIFSAVMIASSLRVITARNPVHSVLFLVLTFFTAAALWLLLEAEFLGIVLVLVYVGAVMVLFLFVVMMIDVNIAPLREGFVRFLPLGALVGIVMVAELVLIVGPRYFGSDRYAAPPAAPADYSNTEALGRLLYTEYLYQFEIAAFILLVAIIAAITLTMRKRPETTKYQTPGNQVRAGKGDRLRVVQMDSERRERP